MRIDPRRYPAIIILTFVSFLVIARLLDFRPHLDSGRPKVERVSRGPACGAGGRAIGR